MMKAEYTYIAGAVEGPTDEAIIKRIIEHLGAKLWPVHGKKGKDDIRRHLRGFNEAAKFNPWVVLVDLDHEVKCAPDLKRDWLPRPAKYMCFRIAVKEVEAWLLADREKAASFFGLDINNIPADPEAIDDPKQQLIELVKKSKLISMREDMIPRKGSGRKVGPAYTARIIEFTKEWRPAIAARNSKSLKKSLQRLRELINLHESR